MPTARPARPGTAAAPGTGRGRGASAPRSPRRGGSPGCLPELLLLLLVSQPSGSGRGMDAGPPSGPRGRPGQRPWTRAVAAAAGTATSPPRSGAAWTRVAPRRPGGACVLAARWRPTRFPPRESFGAGRAPAGQRRRSSGGLATVVVVAGRGRWGCRVELGSRSRARAAALAGRGFPPLRRCRSPPPPLASGRPARTTGATFPSDSVRRVGLPCPPRPSGACPARPSRGGTTPSQNTAPSSLQSWSPF